MEHKIKTLAEAITNGRTKHLVQTHVKALAYNEETKHLIIYVDNAAPMHELSSEEGDHHLNNGLNAVYGDDITYEVKMHGETTHENEKQIGREINYGLLKGENERR
ncbi:hypothetical protein KJ657_00780 [Patescibacteria group bacterium]|nr:hypothetical protein [Patescibacteria group bacterium]MBU1015610.1 hypothetical protein [Patescibacteria group bacterium]MBU1685017.1 hypothetical protein [Patescibacteria group bacterium]MBU1938123.1 hypothetical protein [Patescibacteria group bacterium]